MADDSNAASVDRDRLASLFAAYSEPLTRFAIRRVGEAGAADVVSETFLVAWRRRSDIPADRPGPWLFAVAANVIRHEVRGTARRASLHERASDTDAALVLDDVEASRLAEQLLVRQTLAQLSDSDQEVLRLAEWDQLSAPEAAAVLGCGVSAFKVRLHRARKRFAAALARAYTDRPAVAAYARAETR